MSNDMVRMKTPPGCSGASFDGKWYSSDRDVVVVPRAAVPALTHFLHNFTLLPDDEPKRETLTLAKVRKMR